MHMQDPPLAKMRVMDGQGRPIEVLIHGRRERSGRCQELEETSSTPPENRQTFPMRGRGESEELLPTFVMPLGVREMSLGVALLRAGNWKESINALHKSKDLRKGGDSSNCFFLAMAHWHLGDQDEARKWYNRGVQWMEKNQPEDEELRRFRAEAAELLGIEKKKD
jgi:Tetratricopeptide repeat